MNMPHNRTRTYKEACAYADWKIGVKENYPEKFEGLREGNKVQTLEGEVGRINSYSYFPDTDSYAIEVVIGSTVKYFTDPEELAYIKEEILCLVN